MNDDARRTIEVTLPPELTERLRAIGTARGRSAASLIEESLDAYFKRSSHPAVSLAPHDAAALAALRIS